MPNVLCGPKSVGQDTTFGFNLRKPLVNNPNTNVRSHDAQITPMAG